MDHVSAIIGDVHGCGEELDELTSHLYDTLKVNRFVLTGDVLTKGPSPVMVLSVLNDLKARGADVAVVCGNHDLRLHEAFERMDSGECISNFHKTERTTIQRLKAHQGLAEARRWCSQIVDTIQYQLDERTTIVHAGICPTRGLEHSSNYEKIHIKAQSGERHWWEDYNGEDGLIVVGHKPVFEPVRMYAANTPIMVNIDTGCIHGGRLSAYLPHTDEVISVESQQVKGRWNARRTASSVA